MEVLYKDTVEYQREQFGQAIGKFQKCCIAWWICSWNAEQSKSLMFMAAMRMAEGYGAEAQKAVSAFQGAGGQVRQVRWPERGGAWWYGHD